MTYLEINGCQLEYQEKGKGEPLILVHGSASDYRTWKNQHTVFAEQFHTISYSRRYHWPNKAITERDVYDMAEQLEDLKALLKTIGAPSAHFIGHSYGAFLCLQLAIQEPHLVRSLVLSEPPVITLLVSNISKLLTTLKLVLTRPLTAAAIIKFVEKGLMPAAEAFRLGNMELGIRTFGEAVFGPGGYDCLPETRKTQVHDNLTNLKAELLGPGFLPLDAQEIQKIQIPTLLITGEQSVGLFHLLTDRLEELLPNTERIEIPQASHLMHEDNPSAYNHAVLSFYQGHTTQLKQQLTKHKKNTKHKEHKKQKARENQALLGSP